MLRTQHHAKIVKWSDEDKCYIGTCPSLFFGGVHGPDEVKVYRHLCRVVAEWERYEERQAKRVSKRTKRRVVTPRRGPKRSAANR